MSIATPLPVTGRYIVDAKGKRVWLAGVNWSGAHEDLEVPPGLDRVHRQALGETIAKLGFNSVRFSFSLRMLQQATAVPSQYLSANPDLTGKTPIEVYDACVEALTGAGLLVIPNCHLLDSGWCCSNTDQTGCGSTRPGPLLSSRRDGRTSLPGTRTPAGRGHGRQERAVAAHPVKLTKPDKVLYSMHDYPWFHSANQAKAAYLTEMDTKGGYLLAKDTAPVWLGENDVDWCWWGLNPLHGKATTPATGKLQFNWGDRAGEGVLTADWSGVANPAVLELLQAIMVPHTGPGI